MSKHNTPTREGRSAWSLWSIMGLLLVAYLVARFPIMTPDIWWHLATGQWIAQHGLPSTDPFSYTLGNASWTVHQWLADRLLFAIHEAAGLLGLVYFRVLIFVASFAVAYRAARLSAPRPLAVLLLAAAVYATQRNWLDRPQYFTFLMMPALLWMLERHRLRPGRLIWFLPLWFLLWVNLHGGFLLGWVLTAGWTLLAWLQDKDFRRHRAQMASCVLSAFATWINPNFVAGALYPTRYVASGLRGNLQEETAGLLNSGYAYVHMGLVVLLFVAILWRFRSLRWSHVFVGLTLAWLSMPRIGAFELPFAAERHAPIFLLVAVPVLAWFLAEPFRGLSLGARWTNLGRRREFQLVSALACLGLAIFLGSRMPRDGDEELRVLAGRFPRLASQWLKEKKLEGNLLNPYRWGGYLAFRLAPDYKVWIDSRGDLYGPRRLEEHSLLHHMPQGSETKVERLLEYYDVDIIIWPLLTLDFGPLQVAPFTRWLLASREWRLLFYDRANPRYPDHPGLTTAVFMRVSERTEAQLKELQPALLPRIPGIVR